MFLIHGYCPRSDINMGAHGFCIELFPEYKDLVASSEIGQTEVNQMIDNCGPAWLNGCGFKIRDGSNPRLSFYKLQVRWGEWGPEHITVPGNACGLDIDQSAVGFHNPQRGSMLVPHNVDSWSQKNLLLLVFLEITNSLVLLQEPRS